jgi:hypothetical protein
MTVGASRAVVTETARARVACDRNPDQLRRRERYRQTTSPEGVKFGSRLTLRPSISAFAPDRTLPTPVF